MQIQEHPSSFKALIPFLVFLVLFIGTGVWYTIQGIEFAFYQLPAPVAVLPALITALILSKDSLNQTIETLIEGMGNKNIISMCLIFLLAGAFATVAKATGGVEATVNVGLSVIPSWFMLPGIFLISAFIATAMGTSMGTIAALAPIAVGLAEATDISLLLMAGTILSGAMFGDNLSIISDTTIAATRSQGCEMKDKFKENIKIAVPAALIVTIIYFWQNDAIEVPTSEAIDGLKVIPYLVILALATMGINVFVVLGLGIIIAGGIGLWRLPDYHFSQFAQDIYAGFNGMQEIFLLSLLIGGLSHLMAQQGGLKFISAKIDTIINFFTKSHQGDINEKAAEFGIAGVVSLTNLCTANNTVAIVVSSHLAKDLAQKNGVTPKRAASLLDIFSCIIQGLIPWGAQILLIGTTFDLDPFDIPLYAFYPMALALATIVAIFVKHEIVNTNKES